MLCCGALLEESVTRLKDELMNLRLENGKNEATAGSGEQIAPTSYLSLARLILSDFHASESISGISASFSPSNVKPIRRHPPDDTLLPSAHWINMNVIKKCMWEKYIWLSTEDVCKLISNSEEKQKEKEETKKLSNKSHSLMAHYFEWTEVLDENTNLKITHIRVYR